MKVSPEKPFQLIYSLFEHPYLGFLFESYVVQLSAEGSLSFTHQNISALNAHEFEKGLDDNDYELIELMDAMQPDKVMAYFEKKKSKPNEYFTKVFDPSKKGDGLQEQILLYVERRRSKIMPLLTGKRLFEMGNDGEPAWREIEILENKASVLFHFRRKENETQYFPTIKYDGEKIEFMFKNAYSLSNLPAYIVVENKLYHFEKNIEAKKLQPFFNKRNIIIPKKLEDNYYRNFITSLVESFDVYATGFEIKTIRETVKPKLLFSDIPSVADQSGLFQNEMSEKTEVSNEKIMFSLKFDYADESFDACKIKKINVRLKKTGDDYVFYRMLRNVEKEEAFLSFLKENELPLKAGQLSMNKIDAISWLRRYSKIMNDAGITINQTGDKQIKYFLGNAEMSLQINEKIDWFDINAVIKFGEFEIPFKLIRNYILAGDHEIKLPNGEIAFIPDEWIVRFYELLSFSTEGEGDAFNLQKHHLAIVNELTVYEGAKVELNSKPSKLNDFDSLEDYDLPKGFKGQLRSYQKAGYNWLRFLYEHNFGGCLADDMGLGKTVQTLTLLQHVHEKENTTTSLLVMPTSLIYNWGKEAMKFTPNLKILNYTGTKRNKNTSFFKHYDIIITSYGVLRQDISSLKDYHFNYIILDESQVIKNPSAVIRKNVGDLDSKHKLILTGTPIENTTLDLWSQLSFVNPGLLGTKSFFQKRYQYPIEKDKDEEATKKLYSIIKPFLLRRDKSQVATDLPEKIEYVRYCSMTEEQASEYERVKSHYRETVMNEIEEGRLRQSSFLIIQGLTKLRQIANHPSLSEEDYKGDSGKLKEITYMLTDVIAKGHKILVFSQFVKHLKIVENILNDQKVQYAYLDGSTKNRQQQVDNFQNNDEISVFLISLKAGGLGLNLTKAEYVFLLDPWWNPAIEAQAIDRAHRIGQKNVVFTYRFISNNTVEEKIMQLQNKKKQLASDLISTEENFVKSLSKDDLMNILE